MTDKKIAAPQPEQWKPVATPLEYHTRCADGTTFRNAVLMPAHAVEWSIPPAAPQPEPVAFAQNPKDGFWCWCLPDEPGAIALYAAPPAAPTPATSADYAMGYAEGFNDACKPVPAVPLTPRELELIDGMIQAQVYRAEQSSRLGNKVMGLRQQGWDLERAELLRKLRGIGGGGK